MSFYELGYSMELRGFAWQTPTNISLS